MVVPSELGCENLYSFTVVLVGVAVLKSMSTGRVGLSKRLSSARLFIAIVDWSAIGTIGSVVSSWISSFGDLPWIGLLVIGSGTNTSSSCSGISPSDGTLAYPVSFFGFLFLCSVESFG